MSATEFILFKDENQFMYRSVVKATRKIAMTRARNDWERALTIDRKSRAGEN